VQLRHLRYFVKVVEAGSISRAAATIHVAQPALSQQIAELEARLGVTVLQRHARGVRPTPAGEVLYREAVAILRQIEQLPGIVRSSGGEPEGTVEVGMSSTLAAALGGSFIQTCRERLPKVIIRFRVSDSETLKSNLTARTLDLALVFEAHLTASFGRWPLFRQRLFYLDATRPEREAGTISVERMAKLPLVLPGPSNLVRQVLDQEFGALKERPNIVSEGDQFATLVSIVRQGLGGTVMPLGRWPDDADARLPPPLLIEPPLFLSASILWSPEVTLSRAAEAVRAVLAERVAEHAESSHMPGLEVLDAPEP